MAIDVYPQIDGIQGESADSNHPAWIECTSVHWSMAQPRSATSSTGSGHTAERAELDDITFQKIRAKEYVACSCRPSDGYQCGFGFDLCSGKSIGGSIC